MVISEWPIHVSSASIHRNNGQLALGAAQLPPAPARAAPPGPPPLPPPAPAPPWRGGLPPGRPPLERALVPQGHAPQGPAAAHAPPRARAVAWEQGAAQGARPSAQAPRDQQRRHPQPGRHHQWQKNLAGERKTIFLKKSYFENTILCMSLIFLLSVSVMIHEIWSFPLLKIQVFLNNNNKI